MAEVCSKEEEEKNKKTIESLASALHEVSSEERELKEKLISQGDHEYETQIKDLKSVIKATNEKYENMLDEARHEIDVLVSAVEQTKKHYGSSKTDWEMKELDTSKEELLKIHQVSKEILETKFFSLDNVEEAVEVTKVHYEKIEFLRKEITTVNESVEQTKLACIQTCKERSEIYTRKLIFKRVELYSKEYAEKDNELIRLKREAKLKGGFYVDPEAKLLFIIHIRCINAIDSKTKKIMQLLRLRQNFNDVFLKLNKATVNMMHQVEHHVTYGYPNLKSVKELIYKRRFGKLNHQRIALTYNSKIDEALGKHEIICVEDLIHETMTVGPHFKELEAAKKLFPLKNEFHPEFARKLEMQLTETYKEIDQLQKQMEIAKASDMDDVDCKSLKLNEAKSLLEKHLVEEKSLQELVESLKAEMSNLKSEHSEIKAKEAKIEYVTRNLHLKLIISKYELEEYVAKESKVKSVLENIRVSLRCSTIYVRLKKKKMPVPAIEKVNFEEQICDYIKEQLNLEKEGDVVVKDVKEGEEDGDTDDEDEDENADGAVENDSSKKSISKKKIRKEMLKLEIKPLTDVSRVTIKRAKNVLFVIWKPYAFKSPNSETYVILGEAKINDMNPQLQAQAAQRFKMLDVAYMIPNSDVSKAATVPQSEEDLLDEEGDDDVVEEHEQELDVQVHSKPDVQVHPEIEPAVKKAPEAPAPPKEVERQLTKKERKRKELAELDALLADLGIAPKDNNGEEDSQEAKQEKKEELNGERETKENAAGGESKASKKKKRKDKKKEVKESQKQQANSNEAVKASEKETLEKLETRHEEIENLKIVTQEALKKVAMGDATKKAVEGDLKRWHERDQKKAKEAEMKMSTESFLPKQKLVHNKLERTKFSSEKIANQVNNVKKMEEEVASMENEMNRLDNLLKRTEEEVDEAWKKEAHIKDNLKEVEEEEVIYLQDCLGEAKSKSMKLKKNLLDKETEFQSIVHETEDLKAREDVSLKKIKELSKLLEEAVLAKKKVELKKALAQVIILSMLENEKERLRKLDLDLQQSLMSLEDERKHVDSATGKLDVLSETSELSIIEMDLKDEINDLRTQKFERLAEANTLKEEKAKFEDEWKNIDVKREVRKEAECITCQRKAFSMYLKDEHVPGNEHKAEIVTKILEFKEMRDLIGVQDLEENNFKLKGENVDLSLKKA